MVNVVIIEEEDWVDQYWGDIISCKAPVFKDEWPWNKGSCVPTPNPWVAPECTFNVEYENGERAWLVARGWEILCGEGFRGVVRKDGEWQKPTWQTPTGEPYSGLDFRFYNKRLMAATVKALSEGVAIPPGNVVLPDEEESKKILDEADVPLYPVVTYPDPIMLHEERQAEVFARWREKWLATGVCTYLDGGSLVTKSLHEESLKRHIEDQD